MPEEIEITVSARVKNGPLVSFATSLKVDAYDKLQVTVAAGGSETVQLIPAVTSKVDCVFIQADHYASVLTYQVNGAGANIVLDTPQNFIGEGSTSALDSAAPPSTLVFANGHTEDVVVQILVGRSAV